MNCLPIEQSYFIRMAMLDIQIKKTESIMKMSSGVGIIYSQHVIFREKLINFKDCDLKCLSINES